MEWQQIIGFYHLVRHESFTRAADASFRTQSAVSQQIKKLEDELNVQLISRFSRKQFSLTTAGKRFYEFAVCLIENHQELLDDLSKIKGIPKGRLKIAAPFTTLYHLFPNYFKSFMKEYPHIELTIFDRPQSKVLGLLKRGAIDMGVAIETLIPKDFAIARWKAVDPVLIAPVGHPLARIENPGIRDIARYPLILPPESIESRGRVTLENMFRKEGVPMRIIMESSNVELSSRYVESGLGISFGTVVRGVNVLKGRKLRFITLDHLLQSDHIALAYKRNREIPEYMESFIHHVIRA